MLHLANVKHIFLTATNATATNTVSGTLTNGGTGQVEIDLLGVDYASIAVKLSPMNTTSNAPSNVFLGESDITGTSNYTTVTAFSGATATATNVGFLIPVTGVLTAQDNVYLFNVDTRTRKRYLLASASPVTTCQMDVHAVLGRAEFTPTNAAAYNVQSVVNG